VKKRPIILKFINTFLTGINSKLECGFLLSKSIMQSVAVLLPTSRYCWHRLCKR